MDDDPLERYVAFFVRRRRTILLGLVVVTLVLGAGAASLDTSPSIVAFEVDSPEAETAAYVEENFETGDRTITLVVFRGDGVLEKESLQETMAFQRTLHENATVNATLAEDPATVGVGNVVVEYELRSLGVFTPLSVEDHARTLDTFAEEELEARIAETMESDRQVLGVGTTASSLLPRDYTPGDGEAEARLLVVIHEPGVDGAELADAQLAVETLADEHVETAESFVFGQGLVDRYAADATGATFAFFGPIAVVLVVGFLAFAYRDPVDVAVAFFGVAVVILWTAGFAGWLGIEVTQLLVAVPWLLLGLGIDYGLHVTMRYREALEEGIEDVERAMHLGLVGVLVAVGATTVTTAAGFFSGVVSPMGAIREFAVVSAFGIVSAFVVFGAFVPAIRLELDANRRRDVGSVEHSASLGRLRSVSVLVRPGIVLARRVPLSVFVVALLVSAAGVYGAAHVDTSTDRSDFYPQEPPEWVEAAPAAIQPETTPLYERATYLESTFGTMGEDDRVSILVEGDVTDPGALRAISDAEAAARGSPAVRGDEGAVYTPVDALYDVADWNATVAERIDEADSTGDGVPDRDIEAVLDSAYAADPGALEPVVYRTDDGEYRALRVVVAIDGAAESGTVVAESRAIAGVVDAEPGLSATATGAPVLAAIEERALFRTLVGTFLLALSVTLVVLAALLRRRFGSVSLGVATVLPVLFVLSWVLGTMYLLGIPYNAETAIIAGVAIGLGVDYAIHVTTRFVQERESVGPERAIERAVTDTGGTLLASALTTATAVGILAFAFVPSLQRFGIVTALVVVYAYLASVYVLPSLLVLRERWT